MKNVRPGLTTAGLFAGIGGIELGLERAGHRSGLVVENSPIAGHVLRCRFPDAKLAEDVRDLEELPDETELLVGGFPCQDLSSVGPKLGLAGTKSRLVGEVFRLLARSPVPWVVLENVPFILDLDKGRALHLVTTSLEELGYSWAYRVVDTQAFGLPQRRRRWFLVASTVGDPRSVLLADDLVRPESPSSEGRACGFYWTEGTRSLGWAIDSVPPIKCGSSVGVPSPPAIFMPTGEVVTPDIRDAERLQGFDAEWTKPAEEVAKAGYRWALVGNAVSVDVSQWIGERLIEPGTYEGTLDVPLTGARWPKAAWNTGSGPHGSNVGDTPIWRPRPSLAEFLQYPTKPLSSRACDGFLRRARKGSLRFAHGFLDAVEAHARQQDELTRNPTLPLE